MLDLFLPDPVLHSDWRSWANALRKAITEPKGLQPIALPVFPAARRPPPNTDGLLIFSDGKVLVSSGGVWKEIEYTP